MAAAKAEKQARGAGALPVPEENPGVAVVEKPEKKPFWKLWSKDAEPRKAEPVAAVTQETGQQEARKDVRTPVAEIAEKPAEEALPEQGADVQVVGETQKKPFWKFWQK